MNYLSNRRFAKITSHSVCKTRKIAEFPALLLIKSCLPQIADSKLIKQIANEKNVR